MRIIQRLLCCMGIFLCLSQPIQAQTSHVSKTDSSLSLINEKIATLTQKLEKDNKNDKYMQLVGVALGALLTLLTQFTVNYFQNKGVKRKEKSQLKGRIVSNTNLLKFHLSELSYLAIDSVYQYYLWKKNTDPEEKKKALDEHYNDYKYISDYRNKVGDSISAINADFLCYYDLGNEELPQNNWVILQSTTNQLANLHKPEFYKDNVTITDGTVKTDAQNLRVQYLSHLTPLETIISNLN